MNIFKSILTAALLTTSLSTFATSFMSSIEDGCTGCSTGDRDDIAGWLDTTGTELDGASWVQADGSWNSTTDYSVYEMDISTDDYDSYLTSLFVAYDDDLIISLDGVELFNSLDTSIAYGWLQVTNVFDYIDTTYLIAGSILSFTVSNSALGATGVIWSGTTTSVPEPSMVIALGLGLVAFGVRRRKNTNV